MSPILLVIAFLIVAFAGLTFYFWLSDYFELRTVLGYIPGPRTWPFIGLSWRIANVPIQDRFEWLNDQCFAFENGMVVTWFGTQPFVNVRKPRHMQVILSSHSFIAKSSQYNILTPWLDDSLLTSSGNEWIYRRHFMSSAFSTDAVEIYFSIVRKNADKLVRYLSVNINKNQKAPMDIFSIISKYTLNTICKIVTDENIDAHKTLPNKYVQALYRIYQLSSDKFYKSLTNWNSYFYETKSGRDFINAIKIFHDFTEEVIKDKKLIRREKQLATKRDSENSGREVNKTCVDHILNENEQTNDPLPLEDIRQELEALIFAGHDTITTAVCWTLFLLGNNMNIQKKVHDELEHNFEHNEESLKIDKLKKLDYLDRVIKEVLRLYPSVPTIGRCLEYDAVIDNFFIPKGTILNLQIYQLHHDPEVWKDPEDFNPDRFLPENTTESHPYAYIPFSTGPRNCIGQQLAQIEIKMILIAILRKWRVLSLYRRNEVKLISNYILRPFNNKTELYFKSVNDT